MFLKVLVNLRDSERRDLEVMTIFLDLTVSRTVIKAQRDLYQRET